MMGRHKSTNKRIRIASICLFAAPFLFGASIATSSASPQYQDRRAVDPSRQTALVVSQNSAPSGSGEVRREASSTKSRQPAHHRGTTTGAEDWRGSPYNAGTVIVDTPRSRDAKLRSGAPPYYLAGPRKKPVGR
jgi:hypothetical protein